MKEGREEDSGADVRWRVGRGARGEFGRGRGPAPDLPAAGPGCRRARRALQAAADYATLTLAVRRPSLNLVKTALTYVAIFSVGAVTSVSCFEPDFGNPSFRCSPATDAECPSEETCCSDDPATAGGKKPNYFQSGALNDTYGQPIFSGNNNPLSMSGMCVKVGGFTSPFTNGCPVPCNPTWDMALQTEICGTTSKCCQMQELDPVKDCVLDGTTWRAVNGGDIGTLTMWGAGHATNQDPDGLNCEVFASGTGTFSEAAYNDCVKQLTVANQRGFCYDPAQCPCIEDVCDMKNATYTPKCTAAPPATTAPTTMPTTM